MAIEILLRHGAVVNEFSAHRNAKTALTAALKNDHMEAARSLLASGADVNKDSGLFGYVVLRVDTFRMLITSGACKSNLNRALISVARLCHYEVLNVLIDAGVDVDGCAGDDFTPEQHDIKKIQDLGTRNNEDERQTTATDHEEGDQMLQSKDDSENSGTICQFTAIPLISVVLSRNGRHGRRMCDVNSMACAGLLVNSGANVNRVGARTYDYTYERVSEDCDHQSGFGRYKNKTSPLHTAAYCRDLTMIVFLVEKGADVNLVIDDHYVPLKSALENESCMNGWPRLAESETGSLQVKAVLQLLLDLGANPDLCAPEDRARVEQLTSLSPEECYNLRILQKWVAEGDGLYVLYESSFVDRATQLRKILQEGADPELCCKRERQRIREALSWTDEEIVELDLKRMLQIKEDLERRNRRDRLQGLTSSLEASDSK